MKRTADVKATELFSGVEVQLPLRHDLHLARKIWHMIAGFVIVFLYCIGIPQTIGVILLSAALVLALFMESKRLRNPSLNSRILKIWGPVMRNHETSRMSTTPHYIASALIAIGIFPRPVAILSILYLACGDPIASLFGILYGHKGPRFKSGKSLIGTTAGIFTCALVTFFYLGTQSLPVFTLLSLTVIGGLAGGLAELLPFEVDDNFTIPVVSGFTLWLAFIIFGI